MADEVTITIFRRRDEELGPTIFGPDTSTIFPRTALDSTITIDELKSLLPPAYEEMQLKDDNGNWYDDVLMYDETLKQVMTLYGVADAAELKLYITLPRRTDALQSLSEIDFENNKKKQQQTFGDNGKYRKMGLLGAGGQATVFRCQNVSTGQQYAVKMFRQSRLENQKTCRAALNSELKILKALQGHPRIVNVADHCENDLHFFVVMDLLREGDLWDAVHETVYGMNTVDDMAQVQRHNALKENDSRYIFWQLLDAVTFIHSKMILHRDIKPKNILVKSVQSHGVGHYYDVKVADFGLSKMTLAPAPFGLLRTSTYLGTPGLMPPEMTESGNVYDEKVDYWCLGETLYFMVTGILPYDPDGNENQLEKSPRWEILSDEAKGLISGLLKIDCSTRYGKEECLKHKWITQGGKEVSFPMPTEPEDIPLSRVKTQSSEGKAQSVEVLRSQLVSECRTILRLEELLGFRSLSVPPNIAVEKVAAWEDAQKKFDDLATRIADMITEMKEASNLFLQKILPNMYRLLSETFWVAARQKKKQEHGLDLGAMTKIEFIVEALKVAKKETNKMNATCSSLLEIHGDLLDMVQALVADSDPKLTTLGYLSEMTLGYLKGKARNTGITEEALDDAEKQSGHEKQAVIDLTLAKKLATLAPDPVVEGSVDSPGPNHELVGKLFLAPVLLPPPVDTSAAEIDLQTSTDMNLEDISILGKLGRAGNILGACAALWASADDGIEALIAMDLHQELDRLAECLLVEDQIQWFACTFSDHSRLWSCVKRLSKDFVEHSTSGSHGGTP